MATDRLRRRLRDVDPKELSTLSDNFCIVGTPLPDLLAKKDAHELKPIWQQEARDAQGRRRFHGAFTGGFSAGYFNTVGSEAGWTPSSFRSSRKDKHAGSQAAAPIPSRPEDFMDEEDLQDRKAAQNHHHQSRFRTSGTLGRLDRRPPHYRPQQAAPRQIPLLSSLGIGSNESLGFKLLRRMGWKDGQGLGPRVDAEKKARLEEPDFDSAGIVNCDIIGSDARGLETSLSPSTNTHALPLAAVAAVAAVWVRGQAELEPGS